jgi:hypothetical protein
MNNNYK